MSANGGIFRQNLALCLQHVYNREIGRGYCSWWSWMFIYRSGGVYQ
jgi:hypothetical protein